jgi:peptidyl-prolyl cis-trans isomerase C
MSFAVRFPVFAAVLLGFAAVSGAALAQATPANPDKVVAKVDGTDITEGDLSIALGDLGDQVQQMPDAQKRDYLINYIADLRLGAKAAREAKLADTPEAKRRTAYMIDRLLFDEYATEQAKKSVTEDAMKALYADTAKTLKPEQEVHARHILVETEDQAKAVIKRLAAGEDFAKVAAELSKDPGSGQQGGDLGFFTKDRMVPEFSNAAFALEIGKISDPVKSQFGYHVIKVEEKREKPVPTYEEVKDQIEQYLFRKSQQDTIMALRAGAKIERLDAPAATPTPAQ